MSAPGEITAGAWICFSFATLTFLLLSLHYKKYFRSSGETPPLFVIFMVFALTICLMAAALTPVDAFLISATKRSDRTPETWAQNNTVLNKPVWALTYALYATLILVFWAAIPCLYLSMCYYKTGCTCGWTSLLWLIGIPALSTCVGFIEGSFFSACLLFVDFTSLIGMLTMIYTAYGLCLLPMDLLKGERKLKTLDSEDDTYNSAPSCQPQAAHLEFSIAIQGETQSKINKGQRKFPALPLRVIEIVTGVACYIVSFLVFITLLLNSFDKASNSAVGSPLSQRSLNYPLDAMLLSFQKVFPLDFIIIVVVLIYLFLCTVWGIKQVGMWIPFTKVVKLHTPQTDAEGVYLFSLIMLIAAPAINVIAFETTPQYFTFGNQGYVNTTSGVNQSAIECTLDIPSEFCKKTVMADLIESHRLPVMGTLFYIFTWIFLLAILIGFCIVILEQTGYEVKVKKSILITTKNFIMYIEGKRDNRRKLIFEKRETGKKKKALREEVGE